jgi:UDP-N-acetylmuramyl tripeptide synthase
VEAILKAMDKKTGLMGTIEMHIGDEVHKTKNTTPDSITMQKALHLMTERERNTSLWNCPRSLWKWAEHGGWTWMSPS